jgi:hypothetical protein
MRRTPRVRISSTAFTMSRVGMPSVMRTMRGMPAWAASKAASAAPGAGTKMMEASMAWLFTASFTVS